MDTLEQTWSQLLSSYTYDDIGLVPRIPATVDSRSQIDTSIEFLDLKLDIPLIVAPMSTVVGWEFAIAARNAGIIVCIPRKNAYNVYKFTVEHTNNPSIAIPSIGIQDVYDDTIAKFIDLGTEHILLDVANGFHTNVLKACIHLEQRFPYLNILTGNVASEEGYEYLEKVSAIRVGIGPGAACTTSIKTGVGLGQATAVRRVATRSLQLLYYRDCDEVPYIIADGGIKKPGDMCKAIALGADLVMAGAIFAGCQEASNPGTYAGEASAYNRSTTDYIEGAEFKVNLSNKSVEDIVNDYKQGLQSSMAYMGANNLQEFTYLDDNCFVKLSNAAKAERSAHYESKL